MQDIKPIRMIVRVKNNILIKLREDFGQSQAGISRMMGVNQSLYGRYENMIEAPMTSKGEWKPTAIKISEFHGVSTEDIWPEVIRNIKETKRSVEVSFKQLHAMSGEDLYSKKQLATSCSKALNRVTPREKDVLERTFGMGDHQESSLDEISGVFGVSRERVRQIRDKALRKMRHPTRTECLTGHWDVEDQWREND